MAGGVTRGRGLQQRELDVTESLAGDHSAIWYMRLHSLILIGYFEHWETMKGTKLEIDDATGFRP
jgi:hypothetical protein